MARRRVDPPSLPADGRRDHLSLRNQNPSKVYAWVDPNDDLCGLGMYLSDGWTIVQPAAGGVTPAGGHRKTDAANGDVWTSRGMVLVEMDRAEREAENARGQAISDMLDKRMIKQGNLDGFRGQGVTLGVDRKEMSEAYTEMERA